MVEKINIDIQQSETQEVVGGYRDCRMYDCVGVDISCQMIDFTFEIKKYLNCLMNFFKYLNCLMKKMK